MYGGYICTWMIRKIPSFQISEGALCVLSQALFPAYNMAMNQKNNWDASNWKNLRVALRET